MLRFNIIIVFILNAMISVTILINHYALGWWLISMISIDNNRNHLFLIEPQKVLSKSEWATYLAPVNRHTFEIKRHTKLAA